MATESDVVWRIGGNTKDLESANKRAVSSFRQMGKQGRQAVNTLGKAAAAAAAAAGVAAAAIIKHNLGVIDSQAKMAQQLNTTSASLATLTRAGDLTGVSMQQISVAGRTLAVRMGEAQQGLKSAEDAFDALQLSAEDLARLPLDQRIDAVNRALRENVDETQRAAISADLFGTRAATAMKLLDSDTLARARKETEQFGLALSDVQAAQVEHANDTLSETMLIFKGLAQQMTVQVAPVLDAIGRLFVDNATQAGDMGERSTQAMSAIVDATAFVVDALAGVKRAFVLAGDIGLGTFTKIKQVGTVTASNISAAIGQAFGIDTSALTDNLAREHEESTRILNEIRAHMEETLNKPLPGEAFKQFVAEAQAASLSAAEAMVAARKSAADSAPDTSVDPSGGGGGELQKNLERIREANSTELELLQEKLASEIEIIAQSREQKLLGEEEYLSQLNATTERYEKGRTDIEQREADRRQQVAESEKQARMSILQGLTTLMNSESRKMFEVGKAAAISQAVINTYNAATGAYSAMASIPYVGPILGAAAAAAAIATGMAQVQAIRSQSFGKTGSPAAASTTENVNAQSTPVGAAGGGGGSERAQRLYVEGDFDEGSFFSGARVANIAKQLVGFQKDGGEVIFAE